MKEKIYFVGGPQLVPSTLYENKTIDDVVEWLEKIPYVCLDTETEGMFNHNNKIVMLQLCFQNVVYVIDVRFNPINKLKKALESLPIIGQNLKFDYKFLKLHGIQLSSIYDTFLAECCLTNGIEDRQLGLGDLALKYTDKQLNKSVRNQFIGLRGEPFTESQIIYGIGDVTCLEPIQIAQEEQIRSLQIENWVQNEFNACIVLADMEYHGMGFDSNKWLELAKKAEENEINYEKELDNLVRLEPKLSKFVAKYVQGNLFNELDSSFEHARDVKILWSSPSQVLDVFLTLGLKIESTQERFLTKYQNQFPLVKTFIDYKKQQKLVSTYGRNFLQYINPYTQRIHTSFWQVLDTSRVSSGDKYSPNMQNLPAKNEYRNCFIPRPGFKMVSCDFSGQELRLTAEGSKEPLWMNAFNEGKDLHSEVAAMIFKVPLENVRDKPDFLRGKSYRDAAKTVNFG